MEVNSFLNKPFSRLVIIFSSTLFCLGVLGVLYAKNAIIILGCVELMLNSTFNLLLAAFSAYKGDGLDNLVYSSLLAAAEAVGLVIITMMYEIPKRRCKYF